MLVDFGIVGWVDDLSGLIVINMIVGIVLYVVLE